MGWRVRGPGADEAAAGVWVWAEVSCVWVGSGGKMNYIYLIFVVRCD